MADDNVIVLSVVQVKEGCYDDCPCDDDQAGQSLYASDLVEGRTEIAVAAGILIAMTTQSFTDDGHILGFTASMQFIADITTTAPTLIWVDEVCCARD